MLDCIRDALRQRNGMRLLVHIQPIRQCRADYCPSSSNTWWEVLLRLQWGKTTLSAGVFIDAIRSDIRVLRDVNDWLLTEVARLLATTDHKYTINFCAKSLEELCFHQKIWDRFYGLQATSRLAIELTEWDILSNEAIANLRHLSDTYPIWLDDFGSGYSGLRRLDELPNSLPISGIKIDGSIVRKFDTNERSREICAALFYLANRLDLTCVVESVERMRLWHKIEAHTEQYPDLRLWYQGYAVGRPRKA